MFRVETGLLNPDTAQYAGKGVAKPGLSIIGSEAARLEGLGFDGICVPEAGHDPFLPLAVAAEHTSRVQLGTNVAIAFPRSPMVVAQLAWDLQHYSKGRFNLGLGTQVKGHNELRYATPWTAAPGPRMRDYLSCLKAMLASFADGEGRVEKFEGEHYSFKLLPPFFNPGPIDYPAPRIYLAAVNKYMTRLAGQFCDGVRLHPIGTFAYTRKVVVPTIREAAAKAGRKSQDIDITGAPFIATGKDEEAVAKARQALKQHISFYASTRTYHGVLEFHGWEDAGAELHRLSKEGKWTDMPAVISDEMLDEWAISATWDEMATALAGRCAGIFDTILIDMPTGLGREEDRVKDILSHLHAA
ncbi:MAG: TIGR03617 family F420-dependent LLM class oxidoreductase [Deltaproteobacteria bacterium]